MKTHKGRAFAPGHLTAFFMIADSPSDPLRKGSLGAGMCLSKGASTEIKVEGDPDSNEGIGAGVGEIMDAAAADTDTIRVSINGKKREAAVTTHALTGLLGMCRSKGWIMKSESLSLMVDTTLELPEKSGWGMSGAGALSTLLAFREALNLPLSFYQTAAFAHIAEVQCSTGLGDVVAQCTGGVTIRKQPGFPPHGFVDSIPVPPGKVVCLSLPEPISTSDVLNDPVSRERITAAGRNALDGISWFPSLEMLFNYSKGFTLASGVASQEVIEIITAIEEKGIGRAGMAMLGNSVFAVGDTKKLQAMMSAYGRVDICEVDFTGARVLE